MWSVFAKLAGRLSALLQRFGEMSLAGAHSELAMVQREPDRWQIGEPFQDTSFVHGIWPEAHTPAPQAEASLGAGCELSSATPVKSRSPVLVARLRYVAGLKRRRAKGTRVHGLIRPKSPRPVKSALKSAKRAPALFPVKRKPLTAKRPTTRIIVAKRVKKPTAVILKFQLLTPGATHRAKRAA